MKVTIIRTFQDGSQMGISRKGHGFILCIRAHEGSEDWALGNPYDSWVAIADWIQAQPE